MQITGTMSKRRLQWFLKFSCWSFSRLHLAVSRNNKENFNVLNAKWEIMHWQLMDFVDQEKRKYLA